MPNIHPMSQTVFADMDNTLLKIGRQPPMVSRIVTSMMAKGGMYNKVASQVADRFLKGNLPINQALLQELADWKQAQPGRRVIAYSDRLQRAIPKTQRNLGPHAALFDDWIFKGGEKTSLAPMLERGATILDDNPRIHKELWEKGFQGHHTLVKFNRGKEAGTLFATGVRKARGRGFKTAAILRKFIR